MTQFIVAGVMLAAVGAYRLLANLDGMWLRHEGRARARGVVTLQRTPEWERATRNGGWALVAGGLFFLAMGFLMPGARARRSSSRPDWGQTTTYEVDGRQISEEEAERTGVKAMFDGDGKPGR